MGFYIRKSIRMGPVRLNLSKSGLGVSTGVKGFRLGMNGRGTYVHMGRGGLYYRKQLSWNSRAGGSTRPSPARPPSHLVEPGGSGNLYSENLTQPLEVQSKNADDASVLSHFREHKDWSALIVGFAALGLMASFGSIAWTVGLCVVALLLFVVHLALAHRGVLIYDLDDQAIERFQALAVSFAAFFRSQRMWLYEQRSLTSDWKRNAGARLLMKRRAAVALPDGDPRIRTNLSIPCLSSGNERIYFLPDAVVVRQGSRLAAYRYDDLALAFGTEIFIEEHTVPRDAQVSGYAWQNTRRDGGPDRRFKDNRQFPKCLYQSVQIALAERFRRELSKSSVDEFSPLQAALLQLNDYMKTLQGAAATAPGSQPIVT